MTKLSVIILNYNAGTFLEKCLKSLSKAGQSWLKNANNSLEIIIVDNHSSDHSFDMARKFKSNNLNLDIKLIENKQNLGFSAGNNVGVKAISKDTNYVLFLNPDTVIFPGVLQKTIDFFNKKPKAGAVTCRLELADGSLDEACHRGFPTPWRALTYFVGLEKFFPHSKLFAGYTLGHKLKLNKPHQIDACSGAFLLIRKDLGEKLNWWDEDYFWYGEDIDFCYRIKKAGYQVWFLPGPKITHYRGVTSGVKKHTKGISKAKKDTKYKSAKASTKAMRIFYEKHYLDKYPFFISNVVLFGILVLENIRKIKIKIGLGF